LAGEPGPCTRPWIFPRFRLRAGGRHNLAFRLIGATCKPHPAPSYFDW
jgi:hypothetical protein